MPTGGLGLHLPRVGRPARLERDFGVRESVLSGFPATNPAGARLRHDRHHRGQRLSGIWQAPAGGTEIFEYVNEANPLPITDFAFAGRPS